jgi:hypothetical protein
MSFLTKLSILKEFFEDTTKDLPWVDPSISS